MKQRTEQSTTRHIIQTIKSSKCQPLRSPRSQEETRGKHSTRDAGPNPVPERTVGPPCPPRPSLTGNAPWETITEAWKQAEAYYLINEAWNESHMLASRFSRFRPFSNIQTVGAQLQRISLVDAPDCTRSSVLLWQPHYGLCL